jgi:hypothetical protein
VSLTRNARPLLVAAARASALTKVFARQGPRHWGTPVKRTSSALWAPYAPSLVMTKAPRALASTQVWRFLCGSGSSSSSASALSSLCSSFVSFVAAISKEIHSHLQLDSSQKLILAKLWTLFLSSERCTVFPSSRV